ncbi:hypothetical protein HU200_012917 [Digitaria exilis]|uniref:non-specific serine/threonine protein kinase n=1 Tax=Digitaria exilis TaxID=1010633 RepID=A0A835FDF6_9POAL|nr:hypothetical protein HU200_012917 [Digitaria exilis]
MATTMEKKNQNQDSQLIMGPVQARPPPRPCPPARSVAIKVFDKDALKTEVDVMRRVHHPNVIRLHEVMATRSRVYFVMEYAAGGELFARLAQSAPPPGARRPPLLPAAAAACPTATSSPENLLLDARGDLKSPCRTPAPASAATASCTPRVARRRTVAPEADIWSCGVILFVLLAGYLPFNDTNLVLLYRKITQSNYMCPPWFSIETRKLLARLLDPNPRTRMTMSKLKANPWFQKGLCPLTDKPLVTRDQTTSVLVGKEACRCRHQHDEEEEDDARKTKRSKVTVSSPTISVRPSTMNAFDIIARSSGLDLSKMFDEEHRTEARFASRESTAAIVSRLEEIAKARNLSVTVKEKGRVEMERGPDGARGALAIEAEIFEGAPSVHVVEMRKTGGDSVEFREFYRQELRPSLGDIAWSWHGSDSPRRTTT